MPPYSHDQTPHNSLNLKWMHCKSAQVLSSTRGTHPQLSPTEQKNQDQDDHADSTLRNSVQLNRITQYMIKNSWESCADYNTGPTC